MKAKIKNANVMAVELYPCRYIFKGKRFGNSAQITPADDFLVPVGIDK
jgi:hypothetical protein